MDGYSEKYIGGMLKYMIVQVSETTAIDRVNHGKISLQLKFGGNRTIL